MNPPQSLLIKKINTPATPTFECPNCWGIQQWENELKTPSYELTKDTSIIGKARKGFIQRFADRYVPHLRKPRRT